MGIPMAQQKVTVNDLDAWHGERTLDRMRAPARRVVAAWALAAAFALAGVFGPTATGRAVAGLVELRHEVLALDRELDRMSVRFRSASQEASPVSPTLVAAVGPNKPNGPDQPRQGD